MAESNFNAKKSRAHKMRLDKNHSKPHKNSNVSSSIKTKDSLANPSAKVGEDAVEKSLAHGLHSKVESAISPGVKSDPSQFTHLKRETEESDVPIRKSHSRRTVTSNWHRYENDIDTIDSVVDCETVGANFQDLINESLSGGGHFKLRHEKEWEKEKAELQSPWFQLNIQQLSINMSSIPFYIRNDISPEVFTEEDLKRMQDKARQFEQVVTSKDAVSDLLRTLQPVERRVEGKHQLHNNENPNSTSWTTEKEKSCDVGLPLTSRSGELAGAGVEDKELDLLLSLDKPLSCQLDVTTALLQQIEACPKPPIRIDSSSTTTDQDKLRERDLNKLVSGDEPPSSPLNPASSVIQCVDPVDVTECRVSKDTSEQSTATGESKSVSLDDWLDSVLDD